VLDRNLKHTQWPVISSVSFNPPGHLLASICLYIYK